MSIRPKVTPIRPPTIASRLMALFPSSTKSHAYWTPGHEKVLENGKVQVSTIYANGELKEGYCNVKIPIDERLWQQHLDGRRALVASLEGDDGTTCATVVDLDIYNIDPRGIVAAVARSSLSLYVGRSKSKGAHVAAFHEPLTVKASNQLAMGIASKLGILDVIADLKSQGKQAGIEYFPKPVKNKGKHPFGLNMPYLGGERGYIRTDMTEMPVEEFLDGLQRLSKTDIMVLSAYGEQARKSGGRATKDEKRGPADAEKMLARYAAELEALPSGARDEPQRDKTFQLGTMIGSGWIARERVEKVLLHAIRDWDENAVVKMHRHLDSGESASASPPDDDDIPMIVSWRKIVSNGEEPHWFVCIKGSNREMEITDVRDITNYKRFADQCVSQLNIFFSPVKNAQNKWQEALKNARHLLTEEQAPEDATPRGRFVGLLETYLTDRRRGTSREDLLRDVPWEDEDKGRYEFTMKGLTKLLDREKANMKLRDCVRWIKEMGGGEQGTTVKGKSMRLWWVPSAAVQKPPQLSPPELPGRPI
jgi:hypothetical protein